MSGQAYDDESSAPVLGIPVEQTPAKQNSNVDNLPVISQGFCVPHDVVFVMQSNLNPRSTEIYNVIDSAGTPQFRVFAAHGSGSEMNVVNNEGMTVLTLKSKSFSVHNKWYIFSGSSTDKADKIATVKPEEGSQTAQIFLKGRARKHSNTKETADNADFVMQSNRTVTYGKISHQEDGYSKPVGELNKIKPDIKRDQPIPTRIDAYSLHILPGVDSVFMLAVAVALDEAIFGTQQIYGSQFGYGGYGGYGGMGYGGMGYGGLGYGGLGYGGLGMGGPMLLGGGLGLGAGMLMGGFW